MLDPVQPAPSGNATATADADANLEGNRDGGGSHGGIDCTALDKLRVLGKLGNGITKQVHRVVLPWEEGSCETDRGGLRLLACLS